MIDQALRNQMRNPQYAYIAPTYGQAKRVAWEYLKEFTHHIPGALPNEADLRIDIPRPHLDDKLRIMLLGAEKPGSLRGIYLDGCIMDEFAECDPTIWGEVVRPALSDRLGWAIFIGTPKGQNHFFEIYEKAQLTNDWFTSLYKASETDVIAQSELDAAKLTMSPEEYEQEFECSFQAALVGSYYGKLMNEAQENGRITSVPHDPSVPVDTFWDLGIGDTTAIWFLQQVGKEYHWIDYIEAAGVGLDWYVRQLKEGHRGSYNYRDHVLPHDGAARELGTGKSRQETLRSLGVRTNILPRWNVDDGIHACRMIIPLSWFDQRRCGPGIKALKNYERKWDPKNKIFQPKPKHNWASHGSDAFRSAAMGLRPEGKRKAIQELPRQANMDYDVLGGFI